MLLTADYVLLMFTISDAHYSLLGVAHVTFVAHCLWLTRILYVAYGWAYVVHLQWIIHVSHILVFRAITALTFKQQIWREIGCSD